MIQRLYHGGYECNTYVVGNEGEPCFVIDPGYNIDSSLDRYIDKHHRGIVMGYLLTHAHSDHIEGLLSLKHQAQIFLMREEEEVLYDPKKNLGVDFGDLDLGCYLLDDEDEIKLGQYLIKVIHTPFHTVGSCCYYIEEGGVLFSGDTLFHLSIGRTDFPTGSSKQVESSLRKLIKLPLDTRIYPGHNEKTTLENELRFNPFLQNLKV
ncbi:MAG: MBL fold metallo-hydrolase [Bacilli bacterium]|nr:MBL fold metallo-hydrolase [Bacilli bacterium]